MPRGKAIWNANGGFVSVLLTHLLLLLLLLLGVQTTMQKLSAKHCAFMTNSLFQILTES